MIDSGVYEVTGSRAYRGHKPGSRFEARLDRGAERRAVIRGDIRLVERVVPSIRPGSFRLPPGWEGQPTEVTTEAPEGASSVEGSK